MADDDETSSSSCFIYDVFLSFRGHTRYRFTDSLYHALTEKGIKTFRDNEDLRVGDEIRPTLVDAIQKSRMSIVVLCQNYASSTWCLDEIVKIMDCSGNGRKRPLLPIFYQVEPSDVRYQKNQYETAMNKHECRYGKDSDRIKGWNSALYAVADLSGQHCTNDMYESDVINKIVKEVLKRFPRPPLHIKHQPIGLGPRLDEVKSLLNIESHDTRCMLGIYGDGETGKTSFALQLYNEISHQFEAASFLSNVTEKSEESINGLEHLQKALLSEMGEKTKTNIGSTFKGSSEIKRRLGHKRVLLVLDDVDSTQQLDSLAGGGDWFGPGSRIIVTTNDEDVLDKHFLAGVAIKKYCIDEGNKGRRDKDEEDAVGLVNSFNVIVSQLKEDDLQRSVVCVIGMGGLGKTTLAQKIYNSKEVKGLFSCRAWVCVSNDYKAREMLMSLLHCLVSFKSKLENLSEEKLKEKVRECLKRNKYLVVLDDIWEPEVWNDIESAFPDDNNGSRIVITSRNEKVANYASLRDPYHLRFLDEEESWKLFCKKVFSRKECPSDLELIGKSIVRNCGGLPIAVVTIAGLLAQKKRSAKEWSKINEHSSWHIVNGKTKAIDVLKLSYDDLPQKMKPCFLYFGIYPEDKKIRARELIQLWIAEGFIQPEESGVPNAPEPEDVGEEYLNELVDRSLVQVASRRSDDGVKECQVHDLLRDLCISQSKTDKFLEVFTNSNFHTPSNPRRLSLLRNVQSYNSSIKCNQSCTHSLFFFDEEEKGDILKSFLSVSVLYVEHLLCSSNYLKRMPNLRFIKIVVSYLSEIPDCFWKLENLETLDIRSCDHIGRIPSKLWKLQQLRHVHANLHIRLPREHKLIPKRRIMWNLQSLRVVLVDQQLGLLLSEGIFPNLRNLGLKYALHSKPEYLRGLHLLSHLRTLSIQESQLLLYSLDEITFPSSLTKITLSGVTMSLHSEVMDVLGQITNLQILKISGDGGYRGDPLCCGATGDFPQLLVFHMDDTTVSELILEEGAMPRLQRVVFHHCLYLREVPERLVPLGNLQRVHGTNYCPRLDSCVDVEYWETTSSI